MRAGELGRRTIWGRWRTGFLTGPKWSGAPVRPAAWCAGPRSLDPGHCELASLYCVAVKLPLRSPSPEISRGYVPLAAEAAAASNDGAEDEAGDLNEAFAIGPVDRIDTVDPSCALPPALPPPALQRKLCAAACAACCGCRLYCIQRFRTQHHTFYSNTVCMYTVVWPTSACRADYTTADAVGHFHPNIWPSEAQKLDLQPALTAYYRAMEGLSRCGKGLLASAPL
jgi:hypothetical protein